VAWTSSRMHAGKRRTLRATIVTIFSHMTSDVSFFVKCDTIFRLFFFKLPQLYTSNFRKVVRQHTETMVRSITRVLLEIYLAFQQWKNFENPLRTNKVVAMSLVYYFFGTQCRMRIGNRTKGFEWYHFQWFWVTLSKLAKLSMTQSIARHVCDSWASCFMTFTVSYITLIRCMILIRKQARFCSISRLAVQREKTDV